LAPDSGVRQPRKGVKGVEVLTAILTVLLVIASIGLIAVVLLQSGRSAGLSGAIAGGAEALFGKKRGLDEFLARLTAVFAASFMVLAVLVTLLTS